MSKRSIAILIAAGLIFAVFAVPTVVGLYRFAFGNFCS